MTMGDDDGWRRCRWGSWWSYNDNLPVYLKTLPGHHTHTCAEAFSLCTTARHPTSTQHDHGSLRATGCILTSHSPPDILRAVYNTQMPQIFTTLNEMKKKKKWNEMKWKWNDIKWQWNENGMTSNEKWMKWNKIERNECFYIAHISIPRMITALRVCIYIKHLFRPSLSRIRTQGRRRANQHWLRSNH
jgi:hypothetical protein